MVTQATLEKIKKWAEKTGKSEQELLTALQQKMEEVKKYSNLKDPIAIENRARFLLYSSLKRELLSPAKWYEGVILGISELRDITARQRNDILLEYESNPERALAEGKVKVDENGNVIPIDTRQTLPSGQPNPNYGKPIEPLLVRNIVAVTRVLNDSNSPWKLTIIQAMMDQAEKIPPIGKPVKFRALEREETDDLRTLRTSKVTEYIETTITGIPTDPVELLRSAPEKFKTDLKSLLEYHDAHTDDRFALAIVEADVVGLGEINQRGNRMLFLEDETFDLDDQSVVAFVHKDILHLINWGEGTHVVIIGTISTSEWEGDTRAIINVWGIFNDPNLTFQPEGE